jgi:hypothetical protein
MLKTQALIKVKLKPTPVQALDPAQTQFPSNSIPNPKVLKIPARWPRPVKQKGYSDMSFVLQIK